MPSILDPSALLALLPNVLPPSCTLKNPQDAIAALVHTVMSALSFRLVATDDVATDDVATTTSFANNVLPDNWNVHGLGNYTYKYRHEQSSLEFVVKVSKLATRTIINAIAVESDKLASLDILTADYTSSSFFPYMPSVGVQPLVHGFISSNRVDDFVHSYKLKVVQNLVPGLWKEGYTESTEAFTSRESQGQPRPQAPRGPTPPYPDHNPFGGRQSHTPSGNPLSIGRRDLDPLPAHPNPFGPPPLFGGPSGGDGMFVGPDHPIFSERFIPGRGGLGGHGQPHGPWGGDGFLPPMGAPPGARFDPVGPFGPPFGQGPGRGGTGNRGGPPRTDVRGPDNDEFMPPGINDMFS